MEQITLYTSREISFTAVEPFLDYWASQYRDSERDMDALTPLFTWKNGVSLSKDKLASITKAPFQAQFLTKLGPKKPVRSPEILGNRFFLDHVNFQPN